MDYKVKNKDGEYFVEWPTYVPPIFTTDINKGKILSESGADNLIRILTEENLAVCEKVVVS